MISGQEHYVAKPMFYACRRLSEIREICSDSVSSLIEISSALGRTIDFDTIHVPG